MATFSPFVQTEQIKFSSLSVDFIKIILSKLSSKLSNKFA